MENITSQEVKSIDLKVNTELIIDYLEAVIPDEMVLNSFIRGCEILKIEKDTLTISTQNVEALQIINRSYLTNFKDAVKNVLGKDYEITLVADNNWVKLEQKIPSKDLSPKYSFDNYIVGDFNKEVVRLGKKIIESPGKFSPAFINSKSGLGKTHILHAVGNSLTKNGKSVRYIEPNNLTKKITEFSKMGGDAISKFVEELSAYDVLIFDDIQNLGDRVVTLRVLFQVINFCIDKNKQILIASDKNPQELTGFETRFITRFNSGITSIIKQPSLESLIKILEFKLKTEKLSPEKWEKEALRFIARNNSSSIRSIEGAVKRVSFYIEDESNIKYTYTVIHNIFKELTINEEELTSDRIISSVASYYKISKSQITGKSRKANIAIARHMAIWMIRKILDIPFKEIGKLFSNRDHSTIISSIKTIDNKMEINNIVKVAAKRIEENIKSIS